MRAGRFVFRLLLAGALSSGAYLAWISSVGSPSPVDLLPAGAAGIAEVRDAEGLARQLTGTRFATAFAQSATRGWLERTEIVKAFDSVLLEAGRVSGVTPGRGLAFDLVGSEAAVGWYPPTAGATAVPWVAGGRLSVRGWLAATAMRIGRRFGLGATSIAREEVAGHALYSFPGSPGQSFHVFLAGRVLVGGPDRSLVVNAARAAGDATASATREPVLQAIRAALPARGELFAWVRDRETIPGTTFAGPAGRGGLGALLRAGRKTHIDVVAAPASSRPAAETAGGVPKPLPGVALQHLSPLFLLSSREPVPVVLADLLYNRRVTVERRDRRTTAPASAFQAGSGFAVVVTESEAAAGFFPAPRGLAVIGMANAAEAARALPLLFPTGARTASVGGTQALATRESFPLAGEFELWGAAIGPQLVFATETSLIGLAASGTDTARDPDVPSWPVSTVATMSMEKALPLLQRWGAPLSGLVAASWPEAPDIARDLGLLAAVGAVRVTAGSDGRFDRATLTLDLHDLR